MKVLKWLAGGALAAGLVTCAQAQSDKLSMITEPGPRFCIQ